MKITSISDLHGYYPELPGGDLLILAGDYTARGTADQRREFIQWLIQQHYRYKLVTLGNHDSYKFDAELNETFEYAECTFLDRFNKIQDIYIYSNPYTLTFPGINPKCNYFTVQDEEEMAEALKDIPEYTDILVTHGPGYGTLDQLSNGQHAGSVALAETLKRIQPLVHIFGHIHEHGGKSCYMKWNDTGKVTAFYNVAMVNENYRPRDFVRTFEIEITKRVKE